MYIVQTQVYLDPNFHPDYHSPPHKMELHVKVHTKYFLRCLGLLPARATEYDSSRTAFAYFCISGLALIGTLETSTTPEQRTHWADWVYSNLVSSGDGFRGSSTHELPSSGDKYDCANLPATYFSIMILATLKDPRMVYKLNHLKICEYIGRCQRPDGSFAPNWLPSLGPFGENDPRCNYMAAGVFTVLSASKELVQKVVDIDQAVRFVLETINYDGGLGQSLGSESHAGLTFCGLASLELFLAFDSSRTLSTVHNWEKTIRWLAHRQITGTEPGERWDEEETGGLNGRVGKPVDTCYAFWVSASLEILKRGLSSQILDSSAAEAYLLTSVQHTIIGGFAKLEGENPDQMHSYLALTALSMLDTKTKETYKLADLVPALCITTSTAEWVSSLDWS